MNGVAVNLEQVLSKWQDDPLCIDLVMPATAATTAGLKMTLRNLPEGDYRLTSYHHDTFVEREEFDVVVDG